MTNPSWKNTIDALVIEDDLEEDNFQEEVEKPYKSNLEKDWDYVELKV